MRDLARRYFLMRKALSDAFFYFLGSRRKMDRKKKFTITSQVEGWVGISGRVDMQRGEVPDLHDPDGGLNLRSLSFSLVRRHFHWKQRLPFTIVRDLIWTADRRITTCPTASLPIRALIATQGSIL